MTKPKNILQPTLGSLYDVLAIISPTGKVEHVNTISHKPFITISRHFHNHDKVRWVVARRTPSVDIVAVDLWSTHLIDQFPYEAPGVLTELMAGTQMFHTVDMTFVDADHAIGYIVLNLVSPT